MRKHNRPRRRGLIGLLLLAIVILGGVWLYQRDPLALPYEARGMRPLTTKSWQQSSMTKDYPNLSRHPNMWILVSTKRQRVYLIDGHKTIYEMYCSTGAKNQATPTGTFHIQGERGQSFFNPSSGEGANFWVSFKNHGEYLFHSVPINDKGQYIVAEAQDLGKVARSHGCVRLSIPDAQWFFQNIPYNTKVVIR